MYSDIIPPKKKYSRAQTEEYNSVKFSSPHLPYSQPTQTKKPIILFVAACVVVVILMYHNLSHTTKIHIAPKVTRFDIKENISLIVQGRENKSLTYSLVYVPAETEGVVRNPFTSPVLASSTGITMTASTTGDTKRITIINTSQVSVPLRKETRFDVDGVVYTLNAPSTNVPTEKKIIDMSRLMASSSIYRVIGFKGYPTYESIYAVPEIQEGSIAEQTLLTSTSTRVAAATGTAVPPKELLSLMPPRTLALQKSTVYDKSIGQSALVVFDQTNMENFLRTYIPQTQEYYKALKPFGESISYEVSILDYTLNVSSETGRPISLSSLSVEIVPKIDITSVALQFAGFSKNTMSIIEKQVASYIDMQTRYTPLWSKTVAKPEKIQIEIQ